MFYRFISASPLTIPLFDPTLLGIAFVGSP